MKLIGLVSSPGFFGEEPQLAGKTVRVASYNDGPRLPSGALADVTLRDDGSIDIVINTYSVADERAVADEMDVKLDALVPPK